MKKVILSSLLLALSLPSTSMAKGFSVEVLVFKRNESPSASMERWDYEQANPSLENADELLSIAANSCELEKVDCSKNPPSQALNPSGLPSPENGLQKLTNGQLRMNYLRKKLDRHSAYTPILHTAWRGPIKSSNVARYVHLFGGKNFAWKFDKQGEILTTAINKTTKKGISLTADSEKIESTSAKGQKLEPIWEVDGLARVSLRPYLSVDLDLQLREVEQRELTLRTPVSQSSASTDNSEPNLVIEQRTDRNEASMSDELTEAYLQKYTLKQKRRVKSGEIHYFDHPKFGVIVQIHR